MTVHVEGGASCMRGPWDEFVATCVRSYGGGALEDGKCVRNSVRV